MGKGSKRTPTALLKARGGKHYTSSRWEPTPTSAGRVPAPRNISERARKVWPHVTRFFREMDILTVADGLALEALCEAYADLMEARRDIRMKGMFYNANGLKKVNPAIRVAENADRQVRAWLSEFGLTPASRSKVQVNKSRRGLRGGESNTAPTRPAGEDAGQAGRFF